MIGLTKLETTFDRISKIKDRSRVALRVGGKGGRSGHHYFSGTKIIIFNVIKIGPDRPIESVKPETGPASGPKRQENRMVAEPDKTGKPSVHQVLLVKPCLVISK